MVSPDQGALAYICPCEAPPANNMMVTFNSNQAISSDSYLGQGAVSAVYNDVSLVVPVEGEVTRIVFTTKGVGTHDEVNATVWRSALATGTPTSTSVVATLALSSDNLVTVDLPPGTLNLDIGDTISIQITGTFSGIYPSVSLVIQETAP